MNNRKLEVQTDIDPQRMNAAAIQKKTVPQIQVSLKSPRDGMKSNVDHRSVGL